MTTPRDTVLEILTDKLNVLPFDIGRSTTFEDIGANDLDIADVIAAIEDELAIEITKEFITDDRLNDLIYYVVDECDKDS